jgi:hypothetical protein
MLPAPASIASTPRQRSRASWNPAVPPPPVAGAAVGKELAGELGAGDGLALALGVVALALALAVGVVAVAAPPAEVVGVAGPVPAGENEVGVDEGAPPVQAEIAAGASTVKMTQPMAVSLALR